MKPEPKEPREAPGDQTRSDGVLDDQPEVEEPFDELFESSDDSPIHEPEETDGDVVEAINALATQVSSITVFSTSLDSKLAHIGSEVERIKMEERVITEMHERNRLLTEDYHEREVLSPIFLGLISIADRCEQLIQKVEWATRKHRKSSNPAGLAALQIIREARQADQIEIESYLAGLGVERFETASPVFDPDTQTCAKRINTIDPGRVNKIAERLLPGYRRSGKVIRQERVAVYVTAHAKPLVTKGA